MKKVLSLVLVLALVLGSFSFAFAFDDVAGQDCEDAVDTLVALGVINGFNDGTFRPEDTVTRAQMAKMLVVSLGYEDLITGASSSFSDTVGHWADAYIAFAAGQGMVNGYPNGTFKPDATVSFDEAITMIVRALGYTDDVLNGSWPTNYKIKAVDLDITDDVKISAGGADRGGVAQLLYNALECKMVYIDNEGVEHFVLDGDMKLLDRLGVKGDLDVTPETLDEDEDAYVESKVDLEQYMYESLEVYKVENEDGDKEVVYISKVKTANLEGDVETSSAVKMYIEEADEDMKNFTTDANTELYFNGAKATSHDFTNITDAAVKVVFEAKENDSADTDKAAIGIVATLETEAKKISKEYKDGSLKIDGINLPVTTDDDDDEIVDLDNVTVEGDATSLEDIKEDDVVEVYAADNNADGNPQKIRLVVTRNTLEGKVSKIKDDDEVYIDGVKYKTVTKDMITKAKLGNEYTYFLDQDGKIFATEEISVELTNYAVVAGFKKGDLTDDFGDYDIDDLAQIKLAKADGETVVYDMYSEYDATTTVAAAEFTGFNLTGESTDKAVYVNDADVTIYFDDEITIGTLVKFDTNSDGQINELEIVKLTETSAKFAVDGNNLGDSYTIGSKTVIFDANDDYSVIDVDDLGDSVTVSAVEDEDSSFGTLEVCIVESGVSTSQGENYAVIISSYAVLNSDDEDVYELTMLLNGEEKTYLTEKEIVANTDVTTDTLVELEINTNDEVKTSTPVETNDTKKYEVIGTVGTSTVQAIDADENLVRFDNKNHDIADDAVVYICNYDKEDGWDDTIVGDLDDIAEEDFVKAYDLDTAEEDGVEVIFIYTGDLEKLGW